ncbi:MAG: ATP-dependent DNA ligase [Actinomycetota bacterium]|nr:ATP-dependent DNA ligase [Actinomycetota bacterium]
MLSPLQPPVEPALVATLPAGRRVFFGDVAYEPKWDGLRCLAFRGDPGVVVQSGRSRVVTPAFPEVAAAIAVMFPPGTVADGELVAFSGDRLDPTVPAARLGAAGRRAEATAGRHPVHLVLFDLLAWEGHDLRSQPYVERRAALERALGAAPAALSVTAVTTDPAEAKRWYYELPEQGIEGVVVKPLLGHYLSGQRIWSAYGRRHSTTVTVGGVLGNPEWPVSLVVGHRRPDGELTLVGTTKPLTDRARGALAGRLHRAGADHPWPAAPIPPAWAGRSSPADRISYIRVVPDVDVEVSVDAAWPADRWGHAASLRRVLPPDTPPAPATRGASPSEATRGASPSEATRGASPSETTRGASPSEATRGASPSEATRGVSPSEATDVR